MPNKVQQELVRALIVSPGSSARELMGELEDRDLYVTRREVNSMLYSNRDLFWSIGASPPRWQLKSGSIPTEDFQPSTAPSTSSYPFDLYAWQAEALSAWRHQGQRGVVEAITGSGKSWIGIAAAWDELNAGGKVEILVPSIVLLNQWAAHVEKFLPEYDLGLKGDGYRDELSDVDILIAVVNSARDAKFDIDGQHALLVADECHRYATERNAGALSEEIFESRLGLSATYQRSDDGHFDVLDPFFRGTCYKLNYAEAIANEVTAHFKVALVGVRFDESERTEYEDADGQARSHRGWLINNAEVTPEPFGIFMAEVQTLSEGGEKEVTRKARAYLSAFSRRRQVLANPVAKMDLAVSLVPAIRQAERVIVFTERVDAAEKSAETINEQGVRAAAIHAGISSEYRQSILKQFENGALHVLCAPKVLDEGVDVPAADLGIILAASQSRRQMIQRMGRVIRRKHDGRFARFVIAYVEDTSEDPANGAHGTFLDDITDVASEVVDVGVVEVGAGEKICKYLNEFDWKGPIPQAKMAATGR